MPKFVIRNKEETKTEFWLEEGNGHIYLMCRSVDAPYSYGYSIVCINLYGYLTKGDKLPAELGLVRDKDNRIAIKREEEGE